MQSINKYAANLSLFKTLTTLSKKFVFPSGERSFAFIFLKSLIMVVTVCLGKQNPCSICSIFSLCIESNALSNSTNSSVASRFFAHTPSMIGQIVRNCEFADRFL